MKISSELRAPREAVLTVELDESDVEPYLQQAYRQAVNRLNIPGFRKGKAPRRIVEQMFGRDYLINEAMDSMIQDAMYQGDQANRVRNTERSSTEAKSSRALLRKSRSEASIRLPSNDPSPAASNSKPVPPAPISSTSFVKAGMI